MKEIRPDYFQGATPVEAALRRVKGNYRRQMLLEAIEEDGLESIPEEWLEHDIDPGLKGALGFENPLLRGGEDLPDLWEGEVEIARMRLVDSVHGEVTSLRARPADDGGIQLRIVDEYCECDGYEYVLERDHFPGPLTAEEVLLVFRNSTPCASEAMCTQEFSSDFYPDLDKLADEMGVKVQVDVLWEGFFESRTDE